ncbi:MAG: 16S rRNA (adenine(1518)-N(6)/adenine(1519)-N(6))-dimethyltransferase, partial [Alphaproteobacteria bacterium]|nr:16S rRNA (adenine(1518)-N(6)/adenine(1519)-N(6))-dimethyltransferase [Alphaproteobacteria bacterium]
MDRIKQNIAALPSLRDLMAQTDLQARKSLGQNFLFDLNLTSR